MSDLTPFENGALNVFLPVALVAVFVIILNVYEKFSKESHLLITDKKHTFRPVNGENESCRCTICDVLMVKKEGVYCESCGLCVDSSCLGKVAGRFKCKEISLDPDRPMKHRWLKGNLSEGCCCDVCNGECVEEDMRCIWCHRTLHVQCLQFLGEVCNFGKLRGVVLPPTHVQLGKKKRMSRNPQLLAVTDPALPGWTPLFVIGNRSSGSQAGDAVLSGFRFLLNPLQVCELSRKMLDRLGFLLSLLPESCKPIVLVAGGDGSVAGVLTALNSHMHRIMCEFRVGIVPLGTGNDLARVLGWGKEEPSPFSAQEVLSKLLQAEDMKIDRWCVRLTKGGGLGLGLRAKEMYMYNYLSVGVDARVTLDFHKARNSSLYLGGRLLNKALYLAFGTQQVVERHCIGLEKEVEIELDGVRVTLPELESVVVLNIPSWGAGCPVWQLKDSDEEIAEQSMSDGKLEVLGIYSSFHMAQLQVNLSTPYRIGQASTVRIALRKKLPMQIDGEPWMQPVGLVEVSFGGQINLLRSESSQSNDLNN